MDITILIVIAGAGLIIGILLGLMINALRGDSSKRSAQSDNTARGIDNIMLWHDREGGNLIVDLDGSTFLQAKEMRPDQRARLETCYSQLKRFLGVQDTKSPVEPAIPPVEVSKQTTAKPPVTIRSTPLRTTEAVVEVPADIEDKKNAKKTKLEPIKPLSIVNEIDEILQSMIADTPLLERGLKLVETPSHGISVWVDKEQYETIDAVPDPEIQQTIRAAVKMWEDKPL